MTAPVSRDALREIAKQLRITAALCDQSADYPAELPASCAEASLAALGKTVAAYFRSRIADYRKERG